MISGQAVRWQAREIQMPQPANEEPEEPVVLPTVEELQAIEQAAHDSGHEAGHAEGYAAGHAEGLAAGQAEVRRVVAQIEGILDGFTRPLARLDGEVADALGELAVRIAGCLVGRAYEADPTLLADLVREALEAIGPTTHEVELRLHPDDLGTLTSYLSDLSGVRIVDDTTLARGDLRLHSEHLRIDGRLAARLQACGDNMTSGGRG